MPGRKRANARARSHLERPGREKRLPPRQERRDAAPCDAIEYQGHDELGEAAWIGAGQPGGGGLPGGGCAVCVPRPELLKQGTGAMPPACGTVLPEVAEASQALLARAPIPWATFSAL